jgi:hypothetical protein
MQYKIPQNVDVEDKIIGPLTLSQFVALLFAAGICFFFYTIFASTSFILFVLASTPFALAGLAFAFIRINERSMETFILASASTLTRPRRRIWKQGVYPGMIKERPIAPVRPEEKAPPSQDQVHSQLEHLSQVVDSRGWDAKDAETQEFMSGGRIVSEPGQPAGWHEGAKDALELDETSHNPIAKLLGDVIPGGSPSPAAPSAPPTSPAPPQREGVV